MADATVDEETMVAAKHCAREATVRQTRTIEVRTRAKERQEAWATGYVYGPQESELDVTCRRHWPKAMCFRWGLGHSGQDQMVLGSLCDQVAASLGRAC